MTNKATLSSGREKPEVKKRGKKKRSPENAANVSSKQVPPDGEKAEDSSPPISDDKRKEEIKKLRRKRRAFSFRLRPVHMLLLFILLLFILGGVYLSQQTTMASIEDEKAEKQAVLDSLKVDEERLERMLEYMQTDQYMMQYAREKLGYVFDDDIKLYDSSSSTTSG